MQTCHHCGKEVEDNVLICPECGALVKQYGPPERPAAELQQAPVQPAGDAPATARESVWRDEVGRVHLRGLLCAWLVLCVIGALYTAFSFGCGLYLFQNQQSVRQMLAPYPEFTQMLELLELILGAIGQFHALYVLFLVVYLLKGAAYIWFMVSKRRVALYAVCVASAVQFMMMLPGNGFSAVLYAADILVTLLALRKSWHRLPK